MSQIIEVDVSETMFGMKKIRLDQYPFALAASLTKTAQQAQTRIRGNIKSRFTARRIGFLRKGVQITPARKQTVKISGTATATVFDRDKFMYDQEHGGIRTPKGEKIAVPVTGPQAARKRKKQVVPKAKRPRKILRKKNRYYTGETNNGKDAIFKRVGRAGEDSKRVVMYWLVPRTRVKPRFKFTDDVKYIVDKNWAKNFKRTFKRAIRTAR